MSNVVLYVLMRTDLDSLTTGKMCAQATHAANKCIYEINSAEISTFLRELLKIWEMRDGFGTSIVLDGGSEQNIISIIDTFTTLNSKIHCGITHDPTYPVRDGTVTHFIPLNTCGYIFGLKEDIYPHIRELKLL